MSEDWTSSYNEFVLVVDDFLNQVLLVPSIRLTLADHWIKHQDI
jgi:hypothetical protein